MDAVWDGRPDWFKDEHVG